VRNEKTLIKVEKKRERGGFKMVSRERGKIK